MHTFKLLRGTFLRSKYAFVVTCFYVIITLGTPHVHADAGWQNKVTLSNNSLSGLIVAVDPTVPENPAIIDGIKVW